MTDTEQRESMCELFTNVKNIHNLLLDERRFDRKNRVSFFKIAAKPAAEESEQPRVFLHCM